MKEERKGGRRKRPLEPEEEEVFLVADAVEDFAKVFPEFLKVALGDHHAGFEAAPVDVFQIMSGQRSVRVARLLSRRPQVVRLQRVGKLLVHSITFIKRQSRSKPKDDQQQQQQQQMRTSEKKIEEEEEEKERRRKTYGFPGDLRTA